MLVVLCLWCFWLAPIEEHIFGSGFKNATTFRTVYMIVLTNRIYLTQNILSQKHVIVLICFVLLIVAADLNASSLLP
jgi:hypothetical protein